MSKSPSPDHERTRWREELSKALDRQRIPLPWRDRLLEELEDHLSDLEEKSMDADSRALPETRLGLPHDLAAAAAVEYRKLGFFARRPVLTYVAGPVVLTPILFVAFLFLTVPVLWLAAKAVETLAEVLVPGPEGPDPAGVLYATYASVISFSFRFIPFALLAWMFCRLARRQGRNGRWAMAACALIGLYAAVLIAEFRPAAWSEQGSLMNSLIVGVLIMPYRLINLVQALVPVAIGALFVWRSSIRPPAEANAARPI